MIAVSGLPCVGRADKTRVPSQIPNVHVYWGTRAKNADAPCRDATFPRALYVREQLELDLKVVARVHTALRRYPGLKTLKLHHSQPERRNLLISSDILLLPEL